MYILPTPQLSYSNENILRERVEMGSAWISYSGILISIICLMQNELIDSTNSTFAHRCNREWMHIWEAREKDSKSGSGRERQRNWSSHFCKSVFAFRLSRQIGFKIIKYDSVFAFFHLNVGRFNAIYKLVTRDSINNTWIFKSMWRRDEVYN